MPVFYYGDGVAKERFQHFLDNPPEAIAVDVETISIKERMPLGFAIAFSPGEAFYFQVYPEAPRELELLKPLLFNPQVCKIAHNMLFDMGVLPMIPHLAGFDRSNIFDTNVAARLLGREMIDLSTLAKDDVGIEDVTPAKEMLSGGKTMLDIDPMEVADKCQRDAKATYTLYLDYQPKMASQYPEYFKIEMEVIPILIDLSLRGLAIDQRARAELEARLEDEVEFYRRQLEEYGVEKPGSPQQIGYILGKRGNFLPMTRSKKQLSTREADLEFLDDPMAAATLGWRHISKLLSTYISPIAGDDRFYTEYYLDTVVGRLNSRNRNIQNIPGPNRETGDSGCRYIFLPDNGCFTTGDYSREHLYLLAEKTQDRDMLRILRDPDPKKADIHQHTADKMRVPRSLAKTLNFAVAYGATAKTISEQAKIRDMDRCSKLLDDWFRTYKGAADWVRTVQREGLRTGWAEPTLFGRRIHLPEEVNRWGRVDTEAMKRKAVNYPILGCIPGDSRLLVKGKGYIHIKDASPEEIIWDGQKYVHANIRYAGRKQRVIVKLASSQKFVCSPEHQLLIENSRNLLWKTPIRVKSQDNLCLTSNTECPQAYSDIPDEPLTTHWRAPKGIGNTRKLSFSMIKNAYKLGIVLGRLASDGSHQVKSRQLRWIVAEHEKVILPYIRDALTVFPFKEQTVNRGYSEPHPVRGWFDHSEKLYYLNIYSVQLAKQAAKMGIGKRIPHIVWQDKELLRGFLVGLFDGYGGVSAGSPVFSTGGDTVDTSYPDDIQQALLLFGIRSTVRRYHNPKYNNIAKVRVRAKDNLLFLSRIGFLNKDKNMAVPAATQIASPRLRRDTERIRAVEFTGIFADMYDVVDSESGQFMTEGFITHNSDGEVMKRAIILCQHRGLGPPVMAASVHDSLSFDGDVVLPAEELENIPGFTIPFEVKQTLRWE